MTLQQLRYAVAVADNKSINKAAASLFITQPSLSGAIKELEAELNMRLFTRSSRGITLTTEGEEFLGYARQMLEYYNLIEDRYINEKPARKKFSVSSQHYSFAVEAFIKLVKEFGMDEYEFAMHETKTYEVIDNVKILKSEVGILYLNDFNRSVLTKIFKHEGIEFHPLFDCGIYVFLANENPLAKKDVINMKDLEEYPCLSFEQGDNNSFYFAEEVMATHEYKRIIKADDRSTFLNLMKGLNGYTLCSGILCEELNGDGYTTVPLDTRETMTIGYIKHVNVPLSDLAQMYVDELKKYKYKVLSR
ncbi:MAG: LysR family transcriptional regulator [Clostridiales bacterium]|nr:LysR family transcriptional regulator [Clostridiales bacterium]MBS5877370.1 LysR family transcriptional regulator [Clostridiales bacterium]MDU0939212.1 LysR family transcriptional regulator [Clostridiales bacterium]MDU1042143.1 LysR family transcriptional regulator [Clostridiales bacterium]MDU3490437.1 LysR family transcriptional regulator [Clostridiales bacterium]